MAQGRLLVLDDDTTVGQVLIFGARACGFEARQCTELPPFLAELGVWQPSHLIVDLTLPGLHVQTVFAALAQAGCRARVVVCSGAGAGELQAALAQAQALGLQGGGMLAKPFTLAALRAVLA